jgi:hypothetical protein
LKTIKSILTKFDPVSLQEIDEVKLMNRIDRKYWFHTSKLETILEHALPFYDILEINGKRLMEYETTYFDTEKDKMYLTHHNQKLNRYKIRKRNYLSSGVGFFEIKLKNNKRRTVKERIESDFDKKNFSESEHDFLSGNTPFLQEPLVPKLNNAFFRITLIHKEKKDRCTIDLKPKYWNKKGEIQFNNLVIFELKRGQSLKASPMVDLLRQMKIRQRGLSKYCTGRAVLEPGLKRNAFKPRLRFLDKLNENNFENGNIRNTWN